MNFLTALNRACLGLDPDMFIPDPGDAQTIAAAKAVCRRCPHIAACFDYAVATGDIHAVLGGTTGPERVVATGRTRTARQVAIADRRQNVAALTAAGFDTRTIADRLGITTDVVLTDRVRMAAA